MRCRAIGKLGFVTLLAAIPGAVWLSFGLELPHHSRNIIAIIGLAVYIGAASVLDSWAIYGTLVGVLIGPTLGVVLIHGLAGHATNRAEENGWLVGCAIAGAVVGALMDIYRKKKRDEAGRETLA